MKNMIVLKPNRSCSFELGLCFESMGENYNQSQTVCPHCHSPLEINFVGADLISNELLHQRENLRASRISTEKHTCIEKCYLLPHEKKKKEIARSLIILQSAEELQFRTLLDYEIEDFRNFVLYATRGNTVSAVEAFA